MSEYIVDYTIQPRGGACAFDVREEIIRCRNCKFGIDGGEYCCEGCADIWDWRNVEPDGFCAWGERVSE